MIRQSSEETGTPTDGWGVVDGLDVLWTPIPFKYGKNGKPSVKGGEPPYMMGDTGVLTLLEEPQGDGAEVQVPGESGITIRLTARERSEWRFPSASHLLALETHAVLPAVLHAPAKTGCRCVGSQLHTIKRDTLERAINQLIKVLPERKRAMKKRKQSSRLQQVHHPKSLPLPCL